MTTTKLVSPKEVAELFGVKRSTVYMWRYYDILPEPEQVAARVPLWKERDIIRWAKKTGRMDTNGKVTIVRRGKST